MKLYEIFSDKTLREGCLFTRDSILYRVPKSINIGEWVCGESISGSYSHTTSVKISGIKILGHEPTIVDIFKRAKEKEFDVSILVSADRTYWMSISDRKGTTNLFQYDPCKSLLEQSDETIKSLINIFEKCN